MEGGKIPEVWHEVLVRVSQVILLQRDLTSLLGVLLEPSTSVVVFDRVSLLLWSHGHGRGHGPIRRYARDRAEPRLAVHDEVVNDDGQVNWLCGERGMSQRRGADFLRHFPAAAQYPFYQGIGAYCQFALMTPLRHLGSVEFVRVADTPFSVEETAFLRQLSAIVAVACENFLEGEQASAVEARLRQERDHYRVLVEVTNAVIAKLDMGELVSAVADSIHRFFGIDYIGLDVFDPTIHLLHSQSVYFQAGGPPMRASANIPLADSLAARVFQSKAMLLAGRLEMETLARNYSQASQFAARGYQISCSLPLVSAGKILGVLNLAHGRADVFSPDNLALFQEIAARISMAMDKALAYEEISRLKDRLASENLYLTEEIHNSSSFGEIVGESAAITSVLEQVEMVASSDCNVLILGETGTGKELIARAIHKHSERNARTMMKVNCAAIPAGLLESDLFGHEKGAYTGAVAQRIGRFELADQSTLFLDEVGDLPLELQPKLLRALQEHEIERLGGHKVIPVDVRLISATNRDLTQMVAQREFRSDLYYRLNVFPIVIPPLRERPDDIPLLVRYFVQKISRRMNRQIESIPAEVFQRLAALPWPGNVRELENVIERAVILTRGPVLNLPLHELQYHLAPVAWKAPPPAAAKALPELPKLADASESDRDRIMRVLRETNGIVAGPRGAAARLGLKRTTLLSRMQRLGISARDISGQGEE